MSIKKRFKNALFAFFREQLVNEFQSEAITETGVRYLIEDQRVEFKEIKTEVRIDPREHQYTPMLDHAIEKAKEVLVEEAIKYTTVNTAEMFDGRKEHRIVVTLFVGRIKQ